MNPTVSVLIPAHNPDPLRLRSVLIGLSQQTLPGDQWEAILIDNASTRWPEDGFFSQIGLEHLSIVAEPNPGLSFARHRGLRAARAALAVLVDDDNVLDPDYLAHVGRIFAEHPRLGAIGGRSLPEFEMEPDRWVREFFPLLALRDLGGLPVITTTLKPAGAERAEYPPTAPIGAGMALRREAIQPWLAHFGTSNLPDRQGTQLTSGGDNDIVFTVLENGWSVGYFPELRLTHLIPAGRIRPEYLARLNRGIQHSWMQVLTRHDANPWPQIPAWTVPLRQAKAWITHRAWSSPAARIRWSGACGHFSGRTIMNGANQSRRTQR